MRTPAALEFADRLRQLKADLHLVALAVEGACKVGVHEDGVAIAGALLKLQREVEELADQVLPPLTDEQQEMVDASRPEPPNGKLPMDVDWSVADTLD